MEISTSPGQQNFMSVSEDGGRVTVTLRGVLYSSMARALEEGLQRLGSGDAHTWIVDMRAVERIDLVCAYALLRLAGAVDAPRVIVMRPNRRVERTLRHAGLDAVATIEQ